MIKTFEQFDWDDPFGEDKPYKKSYIGYKGNLRDFLFTMDSDMYTMLYDMLSFGFMNLPQMKTQKEEIVQDILKLLKSDGLDDESLEKIERELHRL